MQNSDASNVSHDVSQKGGFAKKPFVLSLAIFVFLMLFPGSLWSYEKAFSNKMYPGVSIGGIDLGGKTINESRAILQSKINNINKNDLTILFDSQKQKIKVSEIGLSYDIFASLSDAYSYGREPNLLTKIPRVLATISSTKNDYYLKPILEQKKFEDLLNRVAQNATKNPKNASIRVENNKLSIILPEYGRKINYTNTQSGFLGEIKLTSFPENFRIEFDEISPDITDKDIENVKNQVESVIGSPIYYKTDSKVSVANSEEIASWITLKKSDSSDARIIFSQDEINSFLEYISKKIDITSVSKKIKAGTDEVIDEGRDGIEVDKEDALNQTIELLSSRIASQSQINEISLNTKLTPREEKIIAPEPTETDSGTPGLYPGKYIEVDLSEQKMYLWEGSNLASTYIVSTGKWSTPTPVGTRYIQSKSDRAYSAKYNLYMPWWSSLGEGYGIHELPEWANGTKEGEAHLGTPVSHGCIRLGVGSAEAVYNWAPIDTPVYIHK